MSDIKNQNSIGGLKANSLAFLTSISFFLGLGFIISFIVLILEGKNEFVRFYAKQTLAVSIISLIASLLNLLIIIGTFLFIIVLIALFIFQIIASIRAFNGEEYKIPYMDRITNLLFTD